MSLFERHSRIALTVTAMVGLAVVSASLEGGLALLLVRPGWVSGSGFLLAGARSIYVREDWSVLQVEPQLVGYDPELTYLLRPGVGRFKNREFDTTLVANSAGLRDDEASLDAPEIIVLGDSYALGWGVEQDETFAQVLEQRTGRKVLNAAMSSFATAREVLLLERLDTSAARAVVVQYFQNDYGENRAFVDGGFALATTPQEDFERWQRLTRDQVRYQPFDYLRAFLDRSSFFPELETAAPAAVAAACLTALASSDELENVPVFFVQIDPWTEPRFNIVAAMAEVLASDERFADLRGRLTLLRLEGVLEREDYYLLDPHLRPRGHAKVAAVLERALGDAGLL